MSRDDLAVAAHPHARLIKIVVPGVHPLLPALVEAGWRAVYGKAAAGEEEADRPALRGAALRRRRDGAREDARGGFERVGRGGDVRDEPR